ncbi:MAG: acetylxylan esterase [Acidobacteriota bacterium]|nr:acetylxylan esterase [Acidobacteriota bacterium]
MTRRELLIKAGTGFAAARFSGATRTFGLDQTSWPGLDSPPPDPLVFADGTDVKTAVRWSHRRKEILDRATTQMYGVAPARSSTQRFEVLEHDGSFFQGAAIRRQIRIYFEGSTDGPSVDLLLYLPRQGKPAPVVLGMNFWGNHTICFDPSIRVSRTWVEDGKNPFLDLSCVQDHHATAACRGIDALRWPVEELIRRGYGLATFYRGDIDADFAGSFDTSLRAAYPALQSGGDNFSVIGAWAWTLSRALDYLMTDKGVASHRVAVYGWSRTGKAAVWAAACDTRFAALLSQESGAGGAKLFRRGVGENIRRLNTNFPHWYCRNFRKYNDLDRELPFDQHLILAAVAPRPIYIASAADDHLSDPPGEFLSALLASPVYRLLGSAGMQAKAMPPVNTPAFGPISYHVRTGGHDVTEYDWEQYLKFLDRYV